jgi:hypothetical protein
MSEYMTTAAGSAGSMETDCPVCRTTTPCPVCRTTTPCPVCRTTMPRCRTTTVKVSITVDPRFMYSISQKR